MSGPVRVLAGLLLCGVASAAPLPGTLRYSAGARVEQTLPLVVVLHGYGATPDDILGLVDGLQIPARLWAPRAPTPVGPGWSWFPLSHATAFADVAAGILAARDLVAASIVDETRTHPTCGRPIVVGFSQGGVLSWALAGMTNPVVGLALPVAGALPEALRPARRPASAPRVRAFHGDADPRVSLADDRSTAAAFGGAGFDQTLKVYAGVGHTIATDEAKDIRAAISDAARVGGCAR